MHQGPLCGRDAARAAPWRNQSTGYSRRRLSESPLEQVLGIPWVSSVSTGLIGKGESSDSPFFYFRSLPRSPLFLNLISLFFHFFRINLPRVGSPLRTF